MVDPLLSRTPLAFVAALLVGAAAGCTFYAPTVVDCSITCVEGGACPMGTSCRNGFCRLESATGDCACRLGDTRPCGGGRGECKPGTETCTSERVWSGICVNEGRPSQELCNNKDDDCDGLVDDDVVDTQACALTLGVCAGKRNRCESGAQLACEPSDYGASYEAGPEARCDGLDNDCDGFTDVRGLTVLTLESGPLAPFQLLPLRQGFALVYERRPSGGTAELVVARYDDAITFQRAVVALRPLPQRFHARAVGDVVYLAHASDGGVGLTRVDTTAGPDAGLETFTPLLDAGFSSGLRLGVAERAVATFQADGDDRARMLVWELDGGLAQVRDLNAGPGAPATVSLNSVNVSDKGHFVIYSAENAAGSTVRELIRLGDGGVWRVPFFGGVEAELSEWDAGVSSTYSYSSASNSLSGVYYLPDLTQGLDEVAAVASFLAQQWGASSAFRTQAGALQVAAHERIPGGGEQLVVGTSAPSGTTFTFRLRNLDGGSGPPQLVGSTGEPAWLIVGWSEGSSIRARKVCAP